MDRELESKLAEMRAEIEGLRSQIKALVDDDGPKVDTHGAVDNAASPFTVGEQVVTDTDAVKAGSTTACRSLETIPASGLQQIFKFAGGGYAVQVADLSTKEPPDPEPVLLMRMKCTVDGVEKVSTAYCSLKMLKDAIFGDVEIDARVAYDQYNNKFVQYKLTWDATAQEFNEGVDPVPGDIIEGESHISQHT